MFTLIMTLVLLDGEKEITVGTYTDELQCVAQAGILSISGIEKELLICVEEKSITHML